MTTVELTAEEKEARRVTLLEEAKAITEAMAERRAQNDAAAARRKELYDALIDELGMTGEAVAKAVGVSYASVYQARRRNSSRDAALGSVPD